MNSHTSPDPSAPECAATHPVGAVCTRPAGHEGDHQDARYDAPATLNWGPEATARLNASNAEYFRNACEFCFGTGTYVGQDRRSRFTCPNCNGTGNR